MARGTETDPAVRIAELERRRVEIEAEVARIRKGEIDLMDTTQLKERFYQMGETARALLSDFRQVEQNFRDLDRQVRERIALWEGGKGELLESIFGERDAIADSDQGKSFRAFWDFLMSPARQEELSARWSVSCRWTRSPRHAPTGACCASTTIGWRRARRPSVPWRASRDSCASYLDDQAWLENRRIMTIIRDIEQQALAIRNSPPEGDLRR